MSCWDEPNLISPLCLIIGWGYWFIAHPTAGDLSWAFSWLPMSTSLWTFVQCPNLCNLLSVQFVQISVQFTAQISIQRRDLLIH